MKRPMRGAEPQFSHPVRQLTMMLIAVALVGAGAYVALPRVADVFLANIWLNGFIALVFVIGVLACFWQVLQLGASVRWIEGFASGRSAAEAAAPPRLLAPLAALLGERGARSRISASSARSMLDSVATRIDEERDITRYIINLLIFLGLLGTFYGLAITVPAVVETIRSLAPEEGEGSIAVFDRLMTGLEAQLGGMGTAFSTSLLGLAGSLVVGLLELFAGHGQNRFYRQLEEWLSSITRLGVVAGDVEGASEQNALIAMLEQMAEQMEAMQSLYAQAEANQARVENRLEGLADAVERLAGRAEGDTGLAPVLAQIAEGQDRIAAALLARPTPEADPIDPVTRLHLRSIDTQMLRILEEMVAGREETIADLRTDLAHLTAAVRQLSRAAAPGAASSTPAAPGRGG